MTDQATDTEHHKVLAEGVDEELVESNRRLFSGNAQLVVALLAMLYAAVHMVALNGVSIERWTGIDIGFLPNLPIETWNFRIVHIAGALALGLLIYSARVFEKDDSTARNRMFMFASAAVAVPALVAGITAIRFASLIQSGTLPEMGGLTTWAAFQGTEIYEQEVFWFGLPLLVSTFGALALGWFERRAQIGRAHV